MKQKPKTDPSNVSAPVNPSVPITKQASTKHNLRKTRFVNEYIESGNGKQSAIKAGYSENGAEVQAHRLLSDVNVQNSIQSKTRAIYTEQSLKEALQDVLDNPDNQRIKIAAVELAMRNLAMLVDRQKVETVDTRPIQEIAEAASDSLSSLTVTEQGIESDTVTVKSTPSA